MYLWNRFLEVGLLIKGKMHIYNFAPYCQTPLHQDHTISHYPPATNDSVVFTTASPIEYTVKHFNFASLTGEEQYLSVVLICISFTMGGIEHCLIYGRAICEFFYEFCSYLLPIFPKGYGFFLLFPPSFIMI